MILNVNEDIYLAKLIIQAIGNLSKRKTVKYISSLSQRAWYTKIAKMIVVDFGVDFASEKIIAYLKKNEIVRTVITVKKGYKNWYHKNTKTRSNVKISYETRFVGEKGSSSTSSTQSNTTTKWITPSNSVCKNNGGRVNSGEVNNGECYSNWNNAKKICSASGGELPSINELKKVITDCGGEMNDENIQNQDNSSYRSCYERKSFTSSHYWSSTTYASNTSHAWRVYFHLGYAGSKDKSGSLYIRCVRSGQ